MNLREISFNIKHKTKIIFNKYLTILRQVDLSLWHVCGRLRFYITTARKKDAMKLFQLVVHAISIVAFLTAIDYFSKKSSIRIGIHPEPAGYYMDTVEKFYKENEIELPQIFREGGQFSWMFKKEKDFKDHVTIGDGTSDEDLIRAIKKGQKMGGYVHRRIERLEHQMEKYHYKKTIYFNLESRGFYPKEYFKKPLSLLKKQLSPEDYYIFLSALISSREVHHDIFIKNDGEIDLRDLTIVIPSPLSKITERRENNILDAKIVDSYLHQINKNANTAIISLPFLKNGETFSLNVITRENELEKDSFFYSFKESKTIDLKKLILTGIITFFCMVFLVIFFK